MQQRLLTAGGSTLLLIVATCSSLLHNSAVNCQSAITANSTVDSITPSPSVKATSTIASQVSSEAVADRVTTFLPFTPKPTPTYSMLNPVFATPVVTYGNVTCEKFLDTGSCASTLDPFPDVITNLSRSNQSGATRIINTIINLLGDYGAPEHCISAAIPLLCRYSFPTCDPAYRVPTYQPICKRDCVIIQDFLCREPWMAMERLIPLLNLETLDQPDCEPLEYIEAGDSPMCISTLNKDFVPLPLLTGPDCYSGLGRGYQGTVNVTVSGRTCQSWSISYPHQHLLAYENYSELSGGHNFCRNPGERGIKPWCFTLDREKRWEYCDIPQCAPGPTCIPYLTGTCRTVGTIGKDWIFVDTSITNFTKLNVNMEILRTHISNYTPACAEILFEYTCISNYPSCDLSHISPRPAQPCQTFCRRIHDVCGEEIHELSSFSELLDEVKITFNCSVLPEMNGGDAPECYEQLNKAPTAEQESVNCYSDFDLGVSYRGDVAVTMSGKTCQKWISQYPHPHSITPLNRSELEGHNHCRNPDGRGKSPWCYTTDNSTRWEYCNIPTCSDQDAAIPQYYYLIIGAGSGILFLILVLCLAICCCHCFCSKHTKPIVIEGVFDNQIKEKYEEDPVKLTSVQKTNVDVSDNPLYTVSPTLATDYQQPMEYDGIKLPEFPRENIVYIKDLGQGQFGEVVQAEVSGTEPNKEKRTVAIKVMKEGASAKIKKEFFREAFLMNSFDHPNILKLLGVCIKQEPLCMIFEYMELGDLNNLLRQNSPNRHLGSNPSTGCGKTSLSTQQLVCISIDIAAGLKYLAQNHFVHRDLATRNCLVSRSFQVKISDFGLSQDVYSTDYFKMGDAELLPIRWMPPEAILHAKFTIQSDIWSFGVVLWEIFSFGIQPYYSKSNEEVVHHIREGNVLTCPDGCPQEIYDLMVDCWIMEAAERPTASEIYDGLQRWSPDLSSMLQNQTGQTNNGYQNMATIREYIKQDSEGVVGEIEMSSASSKVENCHEWDKNTNV